jgi:hypothetical protein
MIPMSIHLVAYAAAGPAHAIAAPALDGMMLFGFLMSVFTLVVFLHQQQFGGALPLLAVCLGAMAVYGFVQGELATGVLVGLWSCATLRHWRRQRILLADKAEASEATDWAEESRITRMFGPMRSRRRRGGNSMGGEA